MPRDKCKEAASKYLELREAVVNVAGNARPYYDRWRVVSGEAIDRLVKALARVDGGEA